MSDQPIRTPSSKEEPQTNQVELSPSEFASYWLAAIVESADDAIISKSLEGIITSWNKGAQRIFGYGAEEVIGRHISLLIPDDYIDEEPQILARLRRGEKIEHYETVRRRKDGQFINISLTVSPIRASDGTIVGASKIARDITAQKAAQLHLQRALAEAEKAKKEAEEAKREAEEANRLKDQFLSTISHELRTPLTSVMGWVSMLCNNHLNDVMARKALETIDRNVKLQAQLIEDLLDITRIVNGKMRMEFKPLNLLTVIHAAVDTIMPAAQAKQLRIQVTTEPGMGMVMGDAERLQQVIWNLLSNAVKFTPGGGRICLEMEQHESVVKVTISDNGIGINAEFLSQIFDRFTQEDSSSTRVYGGLGMGLAIVKYIIEAHGGTIAATSAGLGKGTTFTLTLPLEGKPQNEFMKPLGLGGLPANVTEFPAELQGLKIMVVDDELDTCEMLQTALEQCGSVVQIATSASQALAQLRESRPDILICDINMPQMDGYQLIQHIREQEAQQENPMPAIALTALTRIEDRVKALTAGYQMHVPKPVELSELYTVLAGITSFIVKPVPARSVVADQSGTSTTTSDNISL